MPEQWHAGRQPNPYELSELASPVDVNQKLAQLEANSQVMRAAGCHKNDILIEQTAGVMALAGAVHTHEVLGLRDRLWRSIAGVVSQSPPFAIDLADRASVRWIFHDTDLPLYTTAPGEPVSSLTVSLFGDRRGGNPMVAQAFRGMELARERTKFPTLPPALLGVEPQKFGVPGFRKYQYPSQQLESCSLETLVSSVRALSTASNVKLDAIAPFAGHDYWTRAVTTVQRYDLSDVGIDAAGDRLKPPANDDDLSHFENLRSMYSWFRDERLLTPRQGYDYLYDHYIAEGLESLQPTQAVEAWLRRKQVIPLTELPAKTPTEL